MWPNGQRTRGSRLCRMHAEGTVATFVDTRAGHLHLGDNFGCATVADFDRWGVLADSQAYLGGSVAAFWTVVPDGVVTVTLTLIPGWRLPSGFAWNRGHDDGCSGRSSRLCFDTSSSTRDPADTRPLAAMALDVLG